MGLGCGDEELEERRGSCTQGTLLTVGRSAEAEEGTWVLEESATAGLWQAGQSETFTGGLCVTLRTSASDVCLPVWTGGLVWNMGFGEQTRQEEDCCWLPGDSLRG